MKPGEILKWVGVAFVALFGASIIVALLVNLYVHVYLGRP